MIVIPVLEPPLMQATPPLTIADEELDEAFDRLGG